MYRLLTQYFSPITILFTILLLFTISPHVHAATDTENFVVKVKLINKLGPSKTYQFIPKGDTILKEDSTIILKKDITYKLAVQNSKISLLEGTKILKADLSTVTLEPREYKKENYVLLENMISSSQYPHIGTIHFKLVTQSNTLQLQPVNHLGFEDYLKGVLPGEMPASWGSTGGQEALRAQAIAARSYVFQKMIDNNLTEIDDTTNYQVYKGFVWDPISPAYVSYNKYTTSAVETTKGMIMTYRKGDGTTGFVTAFFSASNGGQTELPQQYWSSILPYINKTQVDKYDTYKWSAPLQFKKQQLTDTSELDFTNPSSWWNTQAEDNLLPSVVPHTNSRTAFLKLKTEILKDLKKVDPSIESIKIDSIDSINTIEYSNTGKVKEITFNLSYFTRKTNPDNSLYYSMNLGAQSETLAGEDRYATAVEIAKRGWSGKRDKAVLGRGDIAVDALAGSVLAYKLGTPILLTRTSALPSSVKEYFKESLKPSATVYLLGGEGAISSNVESELRLMGFHPTRVAGNTRTDTSLAIAEIVGGSTDSIFLATGDEKSSDALSISPYAAKNQIPIIIQTRSTISKGTSDYLKDSGKSSVNIIGGTGVIPTEVEEKLQIAGYATNRTFGADRVETSIAINDKFIMPGDSLVIGNAHSFIDSLAGSVLAAENNSSILLLHPDDQRLPTVYLKQVKQPNTLFYLGGETIVSKELKYSLSKYIGGTLQKFSKELKLTGPHLRNLFGGTVLMSTDFKINDDTNEFTLNGTGFGHGIGLSQHGAYARSKDGITAENILGFYYQGISIEQANKYIK